MKERTEEMLRRSFNEWPRSTPVALLRGLHEMEMKLVPLIRKYEQWGAVPDVVNREIGLLQDVFPSHQRALEAKRLEWLSEAYEQTGRTREAIDCLSCRLRMRIPRPTSRENCYTRLVDLLAATGQQEMASWYARKALRFCRDEPYSLEYLKRRVLELGLRVEPP
jgi:hypothetical protein